MLMFLISSAEALELVQLSFLWYPLPLNLVPDWHKHPFPGSQNICLFQCSIIKSGAVNIFITDQINGFPANHPDPALEQLNLAVYECGYTIKILKGKMLQLVEVLTRFLIK